jgi:hypothetical protein
MTLVTKLARLYNTTAGLLTSGSADKAPQVALEFDQRIFSNEDIGILKGQAQDATTPSLGCFFGTYQGRAVWSFIVSHQRRNAIRTTNWWSNVSISDDGLIASRLSLNSVYDSQKNETTFYILDTTPDNADGAYIAENDVVTIGVMIGAPEGYKFFDQAIV